VSSDASMGCSTEAMRGAGFYFGYVIAPSPEARPLLPPPLPGPMPRPRSPTSQISPTSRVSNLDDASIGRLSKYFASGELRSERRQQLFQRFARSSGALLTCSTRIITRPGGNMYTPSLRRLHRDLDYYLATPPTPG